MPRLARSRSSLFLILWATSARLALHALIAVACLAAVPACASGRRPAPLAAKADATTTAAAPEVATGPPPSSNPATTAPPAPPSTLAAATSTTTAPSADARQLAKTLAQAEATIRAPHSTAAAVTAAGEAQQLAYRDVATDAALRTQVIAAVPTAIRPAVAANANAVAELAAMVGRLKDQPPDWRIVAPAPPDELLADYKEAAQSEGVPWQVLAAIHLIETRVGRIRGVSTAGAQGPMQFLPSTWTRYGDGGNINNDRDAIFAAARLLRHNGVDRGDVRAAVFSYNHSQHYVNAVLSFADVMRLNERAYLGYHAWQVFYKTTSGDVLLPIGYGADPSTP